jgi:hypothetical protein
MDTPTTLSSELRRLRLSHYAFYLLSSLTSTFCFHIRVNTSIQPILASLLPLLSVLAFFYLIRDLHPTPLSHYLLLSTQTFLLGFLAQRLPLYLFKDAESANTAQLLFPHFSLAFNFIADMERIRLGIMCSDNSFLYPDLINNPFEHSFREFLGSDRCPGGLFKNLVPSLKVYLLCYRWSLCFYAYNYCVNRIIAYAMGTNTDVYNTTWGVDVLYKSGGGWMTMIVSFLLLRPVRLGNAFVFAEIAEWVEVRGQRARVEDEEEEGWREYKKSVFG